MFKHLFCKRDGGEKGKCSCKFCVVSFAFAAGITWGLAVMILAWIGHYHIGVPLVALYASLYSGYAVGFVGGLIGGLWGFVDGFIGGLVFALLYNCFTCCCGCSKCKTDVVEVEKKP